ncbi:MAG: glycosyltransferase family 39 protein [Pyrinomonadaceae bacterium]
MTRNRIFQIACVAFLIAIFVTLRIWKMRETCLWFDEIFSVHAASQPWDSILNFIALDLIHPPLFYLILKVWIAIGGDSVTWLRTLPIAFSVLAILPLILLLSELKRNFKVRLLTLCILIISGSVLKYSIEVRMYSLMLCLSLFSIWLFVRTAERRKSVLPLLSVNILLVYTHYFGWFVVASELVAVLLFYRENWKKVFAMAAVTFASFAPWIAAVLNASTGGSGLAQNIGWMSRPGVREITIFAFNLVEPLYYQLGSSESISHFAVTIPIILLLAIIVTIVLVNWKQIDQHYRRSMLVLITFVVIPIALAFAISWISPYSIWGTRHLMIVFIPFFIVVAIAVAGLQSITLRRALIGCGLLLGMAAGVMEALREPQRHAWCEVGPITADVPAGEPIFATEDLIAYHLWFDHRRDNPVRRIVKLDNTSGLGEDTAYFLPRGFSGVGHTDITDVTDHKLWLVHRDRELKENEPPLRNFLLKGYRISDRKVAKVTGEEIGAFLLEK